MISPAHRRRGLAALAVAATAAGVAVAITAQPAAAASADAMIAEVYGGGGNSGATLTSDFVELANAGGSAASVDGWSVQYLSGSASASSTWQVTTLTGSIPAGARYLVGESSGSGGTVALPGPDATGTIAMSATAGTIALVSSTAPLTCKTAADCTGNADVKDLIGYGDAVVREGSPAPAGTNASALARGTLTDTDDNSKDFASADPTPTNTKGETSGGGDTTPPTQAKIHDIQGTTRLSPLDGKTVTGVTGVVTAVQSSGSGRGFWVQDTQPDANPATSEGVFAFTGSTTPAVAVGDAIEITSATVDEFYPDAAPDKSVQQSTTELSSPKWTITSHGNSLPAAEKLGPNTVPTAYTPQGGNIESLQLQPNKYALDFYESREGMRVEIDNAHVVGPATEFNELWITSKPKQNPTPRGGTLYSGYDQQNSGRMLVESLIPTADHPFPQVNTGDQLSGVTAGPLDFSEFGGYEILATQLGDRVDGGIKPEVTQPQGANQLAVATYNVENLAPSDPQAKFDRLAQAVVTNLQSPDILSIEEIQDNSGATDDGTVASDVTAKKFTDAIVAAGGPQYEVRSIDPENDKDGGEPGGNIRVSFLFNPARVSFVDIPGGNATTGVTVQPGKTPSDPQLSASPGRIAPTDVAWQDSRKPLVGEFLFNKHPVFVIGNHLDSKGGDEPLAGRDQPPTRSSEVQRVKQATLVHDFVAQLEKIDPKANVVVLGDMNDYSFSPALGDMTSGHALTDLITKLPKAEQYSYVFEGNSQVLDHILTSPSVKMPSYDVVHINAEFADQASDHDPQVMRFVPTSAPQPGGGR